MRELRTAESHPWVVNGSRHCPHPDRCDRRRGESYEAYVRRHCLDHQLGEFDDIEDAERNLGVWCLFFLDKHIIGNESIGTKVSDGKHQIIADYEPCWEDAEFLANWDFHPHDLEQDIEFEQRTFRLRPLAERMAGVTKRMKKETKVRGTQKTSRAKAVVTFEHLQEYFVKGNIFFRVLAISAASRLARDHYYKPLRQLWRTNRNIKRLYGAWEARHSCSRTPVYVASRTDACPSCGGELSQTAFKRVGLLGYGSSGPDTLTMRWNLANEDSSGMAIVSFMCAGVDTAITGSRWDFVVFDDPHNRKNTMTPEQRQKVKDTHAELRKQLDARGRLLWLNTPWHIEDASQQIDDEFGDEFHILYRPGWWKDPLTGEDRYYWQIDALGREVWTPERIERERRQVDFWSQVALRPRHREQLLFSEEDFPIVSPERAPLEVRIGRGVPISEEDAQLLRSDNVSLRRILYVDPSGLSEQRTYGCETALVGLIFDRDGGVWVGHLNGGRWNASEEMHALFNAYVHLRADLIRYELSGAHSKHVQNGYLDFQLKKSQELGRTVMLPFSWDHVTTGKSKEDRYKATHPLIKTGRVRILADAGTPETIQKFIAQMINFGTQTLVDFADAFSQVTADIEVPTFQEAAAPVPAAERMEYVENADGGTFIVPGSVLIDALEQREYGAVVPWGLAGREPMAEEVR